MPRDSVGPRSKKLAANKKSTSPGSGSREWATTLPKTGSANRGRQGCYERVTRFGDLVIAWVLLVYTLPLMALIACCIRCEGSGPVLISEPRIGPDDRLTTAIRFRTTPASPPGTYWFRRGQRTRIGQVLWRTHLDGLPMLINVLRGEMTILGSKRPRLLG